MTCLTESELKQLLRQNLSAEDSARAESHVANCPICQQQLDVMTDPSMILADDEFMDVGGTVMATGDSTKSSLTSNVKNPTLRRLLNELYGQSPKQIGDDAAPLPQEIGGYQIQRRIARGGGGLLFEALDMRLGRTVAIKVLHDAAALDPEARSRFDREAQAVAAFEHENIVSLYEFGETLDGTPFLVMEYVQGETLRDSIDASETPEISRAVDSTLQIADALIALHGHGLIHRDIKPANILLEEKTGRVRLADFGLVLPEDRDTRLTQDGTLAGTPAYMSPEQIRNPHLVDHRADLYSLGTVLYEQLTGQAPFHGVHRMLLLQVLHDEPRSPREFNDQVSRDLDTICLKAMEKEPSRRYQSVADFAADLRRYQNNEPITARPLGTGERFARWCRRNRRVALLLGVVFSLLTLMALGGIASAVSIARAQSESNEQRDVALETLRSMVYDVSDELDSNLYPDADLRDDPQVAILTTALYGLERLRADATTQHTIDSIRVAAFSRLGGIARLNGNLDQALNDLKDSLDIADKIPVDQIDDQTRESIGFAHWHLGKANFELGRIDVALQHFRQTLEIENGFVEDDDEDLEFRENRLQTRIAISEVFEKTGDWQKSIDELTVVHEEMQTINEEYEGEFMNEFAVKLRLANAHAEIGNMPPAIQLAREGMKLLDEWVDEASEIIIDADFSLGSRVNQTCKLLSQNAAGDVDWIGKRRGHLSKYQAILEEFLMSEKVEDWLKQQIADLK